MHPALNSFVRKGILWLRAVCLRPPRALPSALAVLRAPSPPTPSPLSATGAGRRPGSCPKRRSTSRSAPRFSPVRQARSDPRRAPGRGAVSGCGCCVAGVLSLFSRRFVFRARGGDRGRARAPADRGEADLRDRSGLPPPPPHRLPEACARGRELNLFVVGPFGGNLCSDTELDRGRGADGRAAGVGGRGASGVDPARLLRAGEARDGAQVRPFDALLVLFRSARQVVTDYF